VTLGIGIQHARQVVREDREIRTDHTAMLGVVPAARWPNQARAGDFIELTLEDPAQVDAHPVMAFFDGATKMAVRSFFLNGGARVTLFGVCLTGSADLLDPARCKARLAGVIDRLRDDEDISLLAFPALAWLPAGWSARPTPGAYGVPEVGATHAVRLLLSHCREMGHRFLVIDAPKEASEDLVVAWADQLRRMPDLDASYGAVYFPWLCSGDAALAPSGAVCGVIARTDLEHAPFGVRVPPANQGVRGYTHGEVTVGWRQGAALVEAGVNPILEQPGRGLVLWGARTLSADPRWQQITARRVVSFVTERVRRDAEWVVFEHLRPELWETVARMVRGRLDLFWSAGLLTGEAPGAEYRVQCDEELNPPAVRDAGQVQLKVLLRPVTATEFIEVELQLGS
jgi:hypothetical protein